MACYLSESEQVCLDQIVTGYSIAFTNAGYADIDQLAAYDYLLELDYFMCNLYQLNAIEHIITAIQSLAFKYEGCNPEFAVPFYFENYGVTYQKIIEAWAFNNFEGRMPTIAFIDRMRQLIWDEPFSVAWAASPEKGPQL